MNGHIPALLACLIVVPCYLDAVEIEVVMVRNGFARDCDQLMPWAYAAQGMRTALSDRPLFEP